MSVWFTSDNHFGHENIIRYCDRPFPSVEAMDAEMVHRWNAVVQPGDRVYVVGDFALAPVERCIELLGTLNGQKHLIEGNHDRHRLKKRRYREAWASVDPLKEVTVLGPDDETKKKIVLCHYAMEVWNLSHRGTWMLHGHSHGTMPDDPHKLRIDVGVDCHDYRPIHLEEIAAIMARKSWRPVDHHDRSTT